MDICSGAPEFLVTPLTTRKVSLRGGRRSPTRACFVASGRLVGQRDLSARIIPRADAVGSVNECSAVLLSTLRRQVRLTKTRRTSVGCTFDGFIAAATYDGVLTHGGRVNFVCSVQKRIISYIVSYRYHKFMVRTLLREPGQ